MERSRGTSACRPRGKLKSGLHLQRVHQRGPETPFNESQTLKCLPDSAWPIQGWKLVPSALWTPGVFLYLHQPDFLCTWHRLLLSRDWRPTAVNVILKKNFDKYQALWKGFIGNWKGGNYLLKETEREKARGKKKKKPQQKIMPSKQ